MTRKQRDWLEIFQQIDAHLTFVDRLVNVDVRHAPHDPRVLPDRHDIVEHALVGHGHAWQQGQQGSGWLATRCLAQAAFGILALTLGLLDAFDVITLGGVQWFHESSLGKFFNATHYWSVQLFFLFMVVHLWGKYWMAAWRGKRALTWATGVLAFLTAVGVGFTGYVITTNFNAQWIAFEAKDVMNAVALGSWINVTNLGQMVLIHVCMLPLAVVAVVAMHVLLVRKHGVVPPIDAIDPEAAPPAHAETAAEPAAEEVAS